MARLQVASDNDLTMAGIVESTELAGDSDGSECGGSTGNGARSFPTTSTVTKETSVSAMSKSNALDLSISRTPSTTSSNSLNSANSKVVEFVANEKGKANIWKHFKLRRVDNIVTPNVAVCNYCHQDIKYSGGTTNLVSHMHRHHSNVLWSSGSDDSSSSSAKEVQERKSQLSVRGQLTLPYICNATKKYGFNSTLALSITCQIARFLVKDLRPYTMVESGEFVNLLRMLDPRYSVPCRRNFSDIVVPRTYFEEKQKLREKLKAADQVALTTDGWTSRSTESYVTITTVFMGPDWSLQNFVLQTRSLPENHTGENLAAVLDEAVLEWGLPTSPKPAIVTDNTSNMERAGNIFQPELHIKCFAHTLNLAAQKGLKIRQVAHILARMRKIVGFFHRSSVRASKLKSQAHALKLPNHKLLIDVPTRWNSAYDIVSRFLEMQCAVTSVLQMKEVSKFRDRDINSFTNDDITLAENIMDTLEPLKIVTTSLCTEAMPTISIVMPILHTIEHKMIENEEDPLTINMMKQAIQEDLKDRYGHQQEILNLASFVDPRFKTLPFLENEARQEVYDYAVDKILAQIERKRTEVRKNTVPTVSTAIVVGDDDSDMEVQVCQSTQGSSTVPKNSAPSKSDSNALAILIAEDELSSNDLDENNNKEKNQNKMSPVKKKAKLSLASLFANVYSPEEMVTKEKDVTEMSKDDVEAYKLLPAANFKEDPLCWWRTNEKNCPLVANLARTLLCIPATSVASERVFSCAGDIVSAQRSSLKPEHVDKLIFLKKNWK